MCRLGIAVFFRSAAISICTVSVPVLQYVLGNAQKMGKKHIRSYFIGLYGRAPQRGRDRVGTERDVDVPLPGDMFAMYEAVTALALLVRRFDFRMADNAPEVKMTTVSSSIASCF